MRQEHLPAGWTEEQVRGLAAHYDEMTDEQLAADIEVAPEAEVTAQEAKAWLVNFANRPAADRYAFAARVVERLSDNDILILFREARAFLSESLKQAS
jgi:hypothetical protein